MKTILLYDHFLALGGAEKVSFQIAAGISNCSIETAFADKVLFDEQLKSKKIKQYNINFLIELFPTLSLFWFYLVKYKTSAFQTNYILSGVFTPLVLFRHKEIINTIVYFHTFPSFVNLTLKQLKMKYGVMGAFIFKAFSLTYLFFLKLSLKQANIVFSNSNSVKTRFEQLGIKTQVLYPPVELNGLKNEADDGYFLSTSRLEENKRMTLVLNAFSSLPHINIHVVGGGSLLEQLKEKYKNCENIKFLGWLEPNKIKSQYNRCRALICIPKNEYFGISPVEALAAGKYVIGVAEGGLCETISNYNLGVLLSSPINEQELINEILRINQKKTPPEKQLELNKFRQNSAKRFNESQFVHKLNSLLL